MEKKRPIDQLLAAKMDRREFLGFMGAAALTVIGVSSILKGLSGIAHNRKGGYGASTYGESRRGR